MAVGNKARVITGYIMSLGLPSRFTLSCYLCLAMGTVHAAPLPDGFVYLESFIPTVRLEIRYYSNDNFVGQRIDGYEKPVGILTFAAAHALSEVQNELRPFGLGLKVFDAYRPQRAVDNFVSWAEDLERQEMKAQYYPDVPKETLFKEGYIAARSGHSRGGTVDLTIVSLDQAQQELDMGTPWDFFGPLSWPASQAVTAAQRANRLLLRTLMTAHGFKPLQEEWWHFTLDDEPYPDTYFDFPVQ